MPPIVQAIDVSRRVGDAELLRDVNLSIVPGDRIALVGAVGSGKSLLLRALTLLDQPDSGEILWQGQPIRLNGIPSYRSRVMYVHQRPTIGDGTVEEDLRSVFELRAHQDKAFDRQRVISLLAALGREESFLRKEHRELSGGELQIAALLRALQLDPQILLLDEPTASLDAKTSAVAEELVAEWRSDNEDSRATVWVSHNSDQARRVADRVLYMSNGRLQTDR